MDRDRQGWTKMGRDGQGWTEMGRDGHGLAGMGRDRHGVPGAYEADTDMPPITPICELFRKQSLALCSEPVQLQLGASTTEELCHSFSKLSDEISKERKKYLGLFLLSDNEDTCKTVCDESHLAVCDGVFQLLQSREIQVVAENVHQSRNLFADTEAEETENDDKLPQDGPQQDDTDGTLLKEETAQDAGTGGSLNQDETAGGDLPEDETVKENREGDRQP
ncbi:hypothetical protein Bbelb_009500 [Branchiostoma belcheri]|nr:hypothetical protein Bbelb_009500 [Branchiostoma belcheri]